MSVPRPSWELEILDPRANFLRDRGSNVTSQFGEDGYVGVLLERIGTANRWCFEVGAGDGVHLSNTKRLRDLGWAAVLIEADDAKFDRLMGLASAKVRCFRARVAANDLDVLLARADAPADLDFGTLDIDGQDFWAWKGMEKFRPRVMLVEFNPSGDDPPPPEGGQGQAGLTAICELGREKGYVPLARTNVNALFLEVGVSLEKH